MKRPIAMKIREFFDTYRKNEYKIVPYLIKDGKKHPVAIVCPGGGYRRVCNFIEGYPFAKELNKMGIHAIVVYYRVRNLAAYPNPQDDLARAVREVHEHAEEWNLDMSDYSVWGSSAGGHLAASFGTERMGYQKYSLPKPGALILVYPVITMGQHTHEGSRNYLIGPHPAQEYVDLTSVEKQVTAIYPPTFLWWGDQDKTVKPVNSIMLRDALESNNIPNLCHEYKGVDHGVGLGNGLPCDGWIKDAVSFWLNQR